MNAALSDRRIQLSENKPDVAVLRSGNKQNIAFRMCVGKFFWRRKIITIQKYIYGILKKKKCGSFGASC